MEIIFKKCNLLLFLVMLLSACSTTDLDLQEVVVNNSLSTKKEFCIGMGALNDLKIKAKNNDPVSAVKVANYYLFCESNPEDVIRYARIAAENGGGVEKYNYAVLLSTDYGKYKKYYNLEEAISWLKKSADSGFDSAKEKLIQLKARDPLQNLDTSQPM